MASLSNSGLVHPPRSNTGSRTGCRPPFPCITPSTETCVVVVSFMIAVPFSLGAPPRGRPLTPATNTAAPIRHRLPDFFRSSHEVLGAGPEHRKVVHPCGSQRGSRQHAPLWWTDGVGQAVPVHLP